MSEYSEHISNLFEFAILFTNESADEISVLDTFTFQAA